MKNEKLQFKVQNLIQTALREDIRTGDITTNAIVLADKKSIARIIVKEPGIICGLDIAAQVFSLANRNVRFSKKAGDGSAVKAGKVIAVVSGPTRSILTAERTALNFLQRLSGIATLTSKFVKAAGRKVRILDTRKTTPGLRFLEKYAVRTGGGTNHRIGLFDAILIKDNHIRSAGGVSKAVVIAKRKYPKLPVEVETKTIGQVKEAVNSGVKRIMLDNMSVSAIRNAVKMIRRSKRKIEIEVSGGITLRNVSKLARTGVDYISVGALTHSAPAIDISLKLA